MLTKRHWALWAAVVCLAVAMVASLPLADDKADEMSMVAAMNVEEDIKPSTEVPKEEPPIMEEPKPRELDTNHIQVIKMPSMEEVKEIIEELEEEIEREKEVEAEIKKEEEEIIEEYVHEKEIKEVEEEMKQAEEHEMKAPQEEMKQAEEHEMKAPQEEMKQAEPKAATKDEPIVTMEIVKETAPSKTEMMQPPTMERSPRNMQMDETSQKEAAPKESSLTDDDIDKIMKMISFPQTDEVEQSQQAGNTETKTEAEIEPRIENGATESKAEAQVQPLAPESVEQKTRVGRAIRSEGKGYYILAFSPIEGPLTPAYTKFDIIPIERSVDGSTDLDDYDEHNQDASDVEEGRLLTRKQFNHYMRKMLRQIRKGTRKIQRKTRLRSAVEEEPTVENFVRKWYATNKKAKAAAVSPQRASWFSWGQKAE